jgi:hypothetical protein
MNIILEDGYNCDYLYGLIISLFYTQSNSINKLLNNNFNDCNTYFIQEYIKLKIITPLYNNVSIEMNVINRFRMFLYYCGWLKKNNKNILDRTDILEFYEFIICNLMNYKMNISKIDINKNNSSDEIFNIIHIKDKHLNVKYINDKVLNLSDLLNEWVDTEIIQNEYMFKFNNIPYLIPIYIDIKDKYINIMECINFENNGDNIQQKMKWDFHSMICMSDSKYYSVVRDLDNDFIVFSDSSIPSSTKILKNDTINIKKIMNEIKMVFYKL